jgi:carbon monoxide dehydrogenase subunit G
MTTKSVVVERLILAPPETVWRTLTDIQGWESVLSGVERIELLSSGPFGVGT